MKYWTYGHDIEGCLRNGSFCREYGKAIIQYINGDCMGEIKKLPKKMVEVPEEVAKEFIPKCCK
jgi:hypothetical protein